MNNTITKTVIIWLSFLLWTLACIYGTYNNTVKHARLVTETEFSYEIAFDNTHEIHEYRKAK